MKIPRRALWLIGLLPMLAAFLLASPVRSQQSSPESFTVDGVHSSVIFRINHLGVSAFLGRFNDVSGGFTWDKADPENASMRIEVATDSIDTNSTSRDNHLKSPDFFNAREFPKITFVSHGIKHVAANAYDISGKLTLHGVTRPVTARLEWIGARDAGPKFGYRGGFFATFTIDRTDFGMDTMAGPEMLSNEVTLMVGIEGIRK